jgi:hypothetical protein
MRALGCAARNVSSGALEFGPRRVEPQLRAKPEVSFGGIKARLTWPTTAPRRCGCANPTLARSAARAGRGGFGGRAAGRAAGDPRGPAAAAICIKGGACWSAWARYPFRAGTTPFPHRRRAHFGRNHSRTRIVKGLANPVMLCGGVLRLIASFSPSASNLAAIPSFHSTPSRCLASASHPLR